MPTTLRNTDILFNDGTTQSTAAGPVVPSAFNAIGSCLRVFNYSTSSCVTGNTIAGSSLLYVSGFTVPQAGVMLLEGAFNSGLDTRVATGSTFISGSRSGNVGTYQPGNTATLPGTWRILGSAYPRVSSFNSYSSNTGVSYAGFLAQRIS
jgi:hypothetical protein